MAQLRQNYSKFVDQDTEILVIGPEDQASFKEYWQDHGLNFIGLPDPKHTVLKLYGQEINLFKFGRMPAQVIVNKHGTVRFVHYGHDMTDIPKNQELLSILEQLNQEYVKEKP